MKAAESVQLDVSTRANLFVASNRQSGFPLDVGVLPE